MSQVSDLKLRALRNALSTATGHIDDLERAWLLFSGATGEHVQTLWYDYLVNVAASPVAPRHINDMFYEWLGLLGFTGALDDRWLQFWGDYGTFPTTFIDFRTRSVMAPFVFTRASTEMDVSDGGVLSQKAVNTPAYYKNQGLIMEDTRTNALTFSEDMGNAIYTRSNLTVSANSDFAPDSSLTADKLLETATPSVTHIFSTAADLPSAGDVCFSFFVKAAGRNKFAVVVGAVQSVFDLATGQLNSPNLNVYMDSIGSGWWRISLGFTNVGVGIKPQIVFLTDALQSSYTGDITKGLLIWGAQVEVGTWVSGYIPTNGATATRTNPTFFAPSVSIPSFSLTNFAVELLISPMYRYSQPHLTTKILSIRTDGNNRFEIEYFGSQDQLQITRIHGGVQGYILTAAGLTNYPRGSDLKVRVSHSTTAGLSVSINDAPAGADASANAKTVWSTPIPTNIGLGVRDTGAGVMWSFLKYFKYWNAPTLL